MKVFTVKLASISEYASILTNSSWNGHAKLSVPTCIAVVSAKHSQLLSEYCWIEKIHPISSSHEPTIKPKRLFKLLINEELSDSIIILQDYDVLDGFVVSGNLISLTSSSCDNSNPETVATSINISTRYLNGHCPFSDQSVVSLERAMCRQLFNMNEMILPNKQTILWAAINVNIGGDVVACESLSGAWVVVGQWSNKDALTKLSLFSRQIQYTDKSPSMKVYFFESQFSYPSGSIEARNGFGRVYCCSSSSSSSFSNIQRAASVDCSNNSVYCVKRILGMVSLIDYIGIRSESSSSSSSVSLVTRLDGAHFIELCKFINIPDVISTYFGFLFLYQDYEFTISNQTYAMSENLKSLLRLDEFIISRHAPHRHDIQTSKYYNDIIFPLDILWQLHSNNNDKNEKKIMTYIVWHDGTSERPLYSLMDDICSSCVNCGESPMAFNIQTILSSIPVTSNSNQNHADAPGERPTISLATYRLIESVFARLLKRNDNFNPTTTALIVDGLDDCLTSKCDICCQLDVVSSTSSVRIAISVLYIIILFANSIGIKRIVFVCKIDISPTISEFVSSLFQKELYLSRRIAPISRFCRLHGSFRATHNYRIPSGFASSYLVNPDTINVRWEQIGALDHVREALEGMLLKHCRLSGVCRPFGVLLHGPPGTGKTLVAKAVATEWNMPFLSIRASDLLEMFVGESEKNLRQLFHEAVTISPCVVFFDEFDSLVPHIGRAGDGSGVMDRMVSQFASCLDLVSESQTADASKFVLVMAATNRPDLVDPSLLRPGRIDRMLKLDIADDMTSKMSILNGCLHQYFSAAQILQVNLQLVASHIAKGCSGADIAALVRKAYSSCSSRIVSRFILDIDTEVKESRSVLDIYKESIGDCKSQATAIVVNLSTNDLIDAAMQAVPSGN